jgi:hypothetical protein
MTRRALVIGHADADGHLITEQVRRNLALISGFDVKAVVDPARTKDHKSWMRLSSIDEIADADLVFFVDLMFAPATFDEEAGALVDFVRDRPSKQFFLIDHHPLPLRRLASADNLRVVYRPEVFDCALGPRSGMMVVAALCENQGSNRLPRGRRPSSQRDSDAMRAVNQAAEDLLAHASPAAVSMRPLQSGRNAMAYDIDVGQERFANDEGHRTRMSNTHVHPKDLEAIVTLLEIAALSLTTEPDATFTVDRLIDEARKLGGDETDLDDQDAKIVLSKASFVKKVAGGEYCLR